MSTRKPKLEIAITFNNFHESMNDDSYDTTYYYDSISSLSKDLGFFLAGGGLNQSTLPACYERYYKDICILRKKINVV